MISNISKMKFTYLGTVSWAPSFYLFSHSVFKFNFNQNQKLYYSELSESQVDCPLSLTFQWFTGLIFEIWKYENFSCRENLFYKDEFQKLKRRKKYTMKEKNKMAWLDGFPGMLEEALFSPTSFEKLFTRSVCFLFENLFKKRNVHILFD